MELYFLNSNFEIVYILDTFKSLIWTDRYWSAGDFDISTLPRDDILQAVSQTEYVYLKESEHLMILEYDQIHYDAEEGDSLILKGRSLESILDYRRVLSHTVLSGNFQIAIQTLLNDCFISPTISDRQITNFEFVTSTDPAITALTLSETQFMGESVYSIISVLCKLKKIGFKVTLTEDFKFHFQLYSGIDRSYNQIQNQFIVFSSELDNLINADYIETDAYVKTIVLVAGEEGVGNLRAYVTVEAPGGGLSGLNRRELYMEANISRSLPGGGQLTDEEYLAQLTSKGEEELLKNVLVKAFDGEVSTEMWNYGEDFFMGDVLQIKDKYGHETSSRVTEMIYSQNLQGIRLYPTFTNND